MSRIAISMKNITTVETRRSWWRLRRWRWYWLRDGMTLAFSVRSYPDEQQAWEDAQRYFEAPVLMVYNHGDPDRHFTMLAGPRKWK